MLGLGEREVLAGRAIQRTFAARTRERAVPRERGCKAVLNVRAESAKQVAVWPRAHYAGSVLGDLQYKLDGRPAVLVARVRPCGHGIAWAHRCTNLVALEVSLGGRWVVHAIDCEPNGGVCSEAACPIAVVADEVRSLAEKTAQSIEEIHAIIEKLQTGSRKAVEVMEQGKSQAVKSVEQSTLASASLNTIIEFIENMDEINANIASAGIEQNYVIENIKDNVDKILQVADDAVQTTERANGACVDLSEHVKNQQAVVDNFKY
ncbi:MAG: hypothetical protein COB51_06115 [Moraxellaceae bacterium]|nr:MAG: hypothetical protein COB51_06115 [Moraxellaceae bacterium]